ncbi:MULTISPECIES: hypothetical protein [unclassified Myroides]|uniref:hypothetical protein n=1 Tax=unclassified Myroides TaxID=2642485 RepID=UPI0015FB2407|nr:MULTISPECIES: hypothetical protein [unclassified Myroides]MBB1149205.1 hypothetical protein [Myroides sp. NP-2]MDM1406964.1 hypothetical protein [Myroides sp. DF42-4-2]
MNKKDKGWVTDLVLVFPELPGILLFLLGFVLWYCSKRGYDWMYDTGGPGVFTNITWIKNVLGETVARRFNCFISWGIMIAGIAMIGLGVWLRLTISTSKE